MSYRPLRICRPLCAKGQPGNRGSCCHFHHAPPVLLLQRAARRSCGGLVRNSAVAYTDAAYRPRRPAAKAAAVSCAVATTRRRGLALCATGGALTFRLPSSLPTLQPWRPGGHHIRLISGDRNGGSNGNGSSRSSGDGNTGEPHVAGTGGSGSGKVNGASSASGKGITKSHHKGTGASGNKDTGEDAASQTPSDNCGILNGPISQVSPKLESSLTSDTVRPRPDAVAQSPENPASSTAPSNQHANHGAQKLNSESRSPHCCKSGNNHNSNSNNMTCGPQFHPATAQQPSQLSSPSVKAAGDFAWEKLYDFLTEHVERFSVPTRNGKVRRSPDLDGAKLLPPEIPLPVWDYTALWREELELDLRACLNILPYWGNGNSNSGTAGRTGSKARPGATVFANLRDERYNAILTCSTPGTDGIMETMCRRVAKNLQADMLLLSARSLAELVGCGFRPKEPSKCHNIDIVRTLFPDLYAECDVQGEVGLTLNAISRSRHSYSIPSVSPGTVPELVKAQSVLDAVLDVLVAMPESRKFVKRGGNLLKRDQNFRPRILVFNDIERMNGAAEDTSLVEALVRAVKRQRAQGVPVCMVTVYAPFSDENGTSQYVLQAPHVAEVNRSKAVHNSVVLNLRAMGEMGLLRDRPVFSRHFLPPVVLLSPETSVIPYGLADCGQRLLALWKECTDKRQRKRNYEVNIANLRASCRAQGADLVLKEDEKIWMEKEVIKTGKKSTATPAEDSAAKSSDENKCGKYIVYFMSAWGEEVSLTRVKKLKWLDDVVRYTRAPPEDVTRCLHLHVPFPFRGLSAGQPPPPGYSAGSRSLYYVQDWPDTTKTVEFDASMTAEIRLRKNAPQWIAARATGSTDRRELSRFLAENLLTPSQIRKLAAKAVGWAANPKRALLERKSGRASTSSSKASSGGKAVCVPHLIYAFKHIQITSVSQLQLEADPEDDLNSSGGMDGCPDEEEFYAGHSSSRDHVLTDEEMLGERKPRDKGFWKDHEEYSTRNGSAGVSSLVDKIDSIIPGLDKYEKKMMGNVIRPESIDVRFNDVHLPEAAIRTIQKTIILPLIRPELFSTGVLSRQQISGILLFGPPGTGKTLLAKAVARESGCTMMSVDLSGILAKWVGESEKNIRAVFTLAAKLAPTVLFVDELDALFSARRSDTQEYRRSAVNEFMASWDGLQSKQKGVVVLGATNRPYDLDDAVLRRLPRRILVDLPNQSAREAIFRIHLRDQLLSPDVNIAELAARTDKWSGSDIKNLCVTAAMNAVAEHADEEIRREIAELSAQKVMREAMKRKEEERRKGATKRKSSGTRDGKSEATGGLEAEASLSAVGDDADHTAGSVSAEASSSEGGPDAIQATAARCAHATSVENQPESVLEFDAAAAETHKGKMQPVISRANTVGEGPTISTAATASEDTPISSKAELSETINSSMSPDVVEPSTIARDASISATQSESVHSSKPSTFTSTQSSPPISSESTGPEEGILLKPPEPFPGYVDYGMLSTLRREASQPSNSLSSRRLKMPPSGVVPLPTAEPTESKPANTSDGTSKMAKLIYRRHFEQSFLETTSSVSDEMESVIALRRWDAKYGGTRVGKKVGQQGKIGFVHPTAAEFPAAAPAQAQALEIKEGGLITAGSEAGHGQGMFFAPVTR